MNLKPDEWNVLERIDSDLCTSEPHLATKFRIFNRLAADDGLPPDEDLITALWPSPRPTPRSAPRRGSPRHASSRRAPGPYVVRMDVRARDRRRLILILALLAPVIVAAVLILV